MYDRENLCSVWKNVRKIRMREKQLEMEEWMSMYDCDICAINETGLMVMNTLRLVTRTDRWVCTNGDWSNGKSGGAGFITKIDIRYEHVMCDCEDISFIKIGILDGKFEGL